MAAENKYVITPFSIHLDQSSGIMTDADNHAERYLSKLLDTFHNRKEAEIYLNKNGDVLVYEVYEKLIPERAGEIQFCSSIIHAGKIAGEYYMTKGHFHARRDTAEIYYCLKGSGYLLMEKENGEYSLKKLVPGAIVYVPSYYAHRSINTSNESLIFLAVYPGDAGHDYGSIETSGFKHSLVERDGQPRIIEN